MGSRKVILILCFLAALLSSVSMRAQAQGLTIIGNNVGTSEISMEQLMIYFKAKKMYWDNKIPVTICLPGSKSEEAEKVCSIIYNKSVRDVQKFWLSLVFQGRAKSPEFFESNQEMLEYIMRTPGAIGVILSSSELKIPSQYILKLL